MFCVSKQRYSEMYSLKNFLPQNQRVGQEQRMKYFSSIVANLLIWHYPRIDLGENTAYWSDQYCKAWSGNTAAIAQSLDMYSS